MEQYKLRCYWGTGAARWAEEQEPEVLDSTSSNYNGDDGIEEIIVFNTAAEVNAFIKGVEASNGWNRYLIHEMA